MENKNINAEFRISVRELRKNLPYLLSETEWDLAVNWETHVHELLAHRAPTDARQRIFLKVLDRKATPTNSFQLMWRKLVDVQSLLCVAAEFSDRLQVKFISLSEKADAVNRRCADMGEDLKIEKSKNQDLTNALDDAWRVLVRVGGDYCPPDYLKDHWSRFLVDGYQNCEEDKYSYLKIILIWKPALLSLKELRELSINPLLQDEIRQAVHSELEKSKFLQDLGKD